MRKSSALPDLSKVKFLKGKAPEKGKVVVIDVWASWCGPCMQSVPHLVALQSKYAGAAFVGLTDEDTATIAKMHGMLQGVNYAIGVEAGHVSKPLMEANNVNGIPHCFVFGKNGELVLHCHPMEPDFEKTIAAECAKEVAFGGAAHSLSSGSKKESSAVDDRVIPANVLVDEAGKKVKISVRSSKGESGQFILNETHTIADLKRLIINKGLAPNGHFDLVQNFPKKLFVNSENVSSLNGCALTIA